MTRVQTHESPQIGPYPQLLGKKPLAMVCLERQYEDSGFRNPGLLLAK